MIELHQHVDGSIPPVFMWERLKKHGLEPCKEFEQFEKMIYATESETLLDYLNRFHIPMWVTQFYGNIKDAVGTIAQEAYDCGVRTLELRWSPIIHTFADLSVRQTTRAILDGMNMFTQTHPDMKLGLIIISMKHHGPHIAKILARAASSEAQHLHTGCGVIGFDLAGAERLFPPRLFKEAFDLARAGKLHLTCHAGEDGPPENIWEAIDILGVERIGHGCAAIHDKELMRRIARDQILVECCVSSNYHTGAVKKGIVHPIKEFLEHLMPVSICTDNPTISKTDILRECRIVNDLCGQVSDHIMNRAQNYTFIGR
jgi:adenosine deaminase